MQIQTCEDVAAAGNVADNDSDVDGPAIDISVVSGPYYGSIILNANGSYVYTPSSEYFGNDTVVYSYCDLGTPNLCDTATLYLTVNAVNDSVAHDVIVDCDGAGNMDALIEWIESNGGAFNGDSCYNCIWTNNFTGLTQGCGATGSATVTFTLTYDCGSRNTTATFTIEDTTAPKIKINASGMAVQCDGAGNTADLAAWLASNGGAEAVDKCSNVTWTNDYSSLSGICGGAGSAVVIFTASDDCGNQSTTSATFTIADTTKPSIDIIASDLTVQCDGSGNAAQLAAWLSSNGGASASDICSGVTWTNDFTTLSDGCGNTGLATVIFTATDDCGNESTTSATFTIEDTTKPFISIVASDLTVQCDGSGNTSELTAWLASNGGASASDACSNVTWTNDFTALSDGCGSTGSATVIFTATDECGNQSTTSATFTIADTTKPFISITASDLTVQCDGSGNASELATWLASMGGASATDACSGVTWTNNYTGLSDGCGNTGNATVTFTATDDCGNQSTTSAIFTIEDKTNPAITTDASDLTVQCDGAGNSAAFTAWLTSNGGASATDACSNVTWTNDFTALSDGCGNTGSATVIFTATDDCGNSSTTSATFAIEDTTKPSITIIASDLTVQCDGSGNTAALNAWLASNAGASASDACSNVTWSNDFSALAGGCGNTGNVTVTFTATDDCGNQSTTSATFTIEDTTKPVITIPASDLRVQCDGSGNAVALSIWLASNGGGATATDACSNVTWTNDYSALTGACGSTGSATVVFTATDDCGNQSTTSATFTIKDTISPVLTTSAFDLTVQCDGSGNTADLATWLSANGGASATDECSGVSWSNDFLALTDGCGNTGSATVKFT